MNSSLQTNNSIQDLFVGRNASSSLAIASAPLTPSLLFCPFATLPINVMNTGSKTLDSVVLAFITETYESAPHPLKQLIAYKRLHNITTRQTQTASFGTTLSSLVKVDEQGNNMLYLGNHEILLDVPKKPNLNFTLTGAEEVLDLWAQPLA